MKSKILIVSALMCVSAAAAYSQGDCNTHLQRATELVSQKKYCEAIEYYKKYGKCETGADVSTEIALCERRCKIEKMEGEVDEPGGTTVRDNPSSKGLDVITLKNGEDIQAIVQEVGATDVKYKRFDNPNGPNHTLKKSEIFMIWYANGSKDVFSDVATTAPAKRQQPVDVNQQSSPNNSGVNSKQPPVQRYTFGKQISPYGSEKSKFLAGFLSFLIPGVGQFYNGDVGGGFLYMGCNIVCNSVWMNSFKMDNYGNSYFNETQFTIGFVGALVVNISSIIHASQGAKKVNIARGYYRLSDNTYLKIQPTIIHQNNFLTGRDYAYGMSLCLNF